MKVDETRYFFRSVFGWYRLARSSAKKGYPVTIPGFILGLWTSYEKHSQYTVSQLWAIAEAIKNERA